MSSKLSQKLSEFAHTVQGRKAITLKEAVELLGPGSEAALILLFSLPFVFVLSLPGLSTVFGAVILLNGYRIARKKPFWLPKKMGAKTISGDVFAKHLRRFIPIFRLLESLVRPRGTIYQQHPAFQAVNGWFLAVGGFFLLFPMTPWKNLLPGLGVFFLSLGILEEDIVCLWLGYLAILVNALLLILVPLFLAR